MTVTFEPLHPGLRVEARHVARIIEGLRDRTLPKPEWTHCAHLTAAAALIDEFGEPDAAVKTPDLIRAYNEAAGGENSDSEGYHHTITLFFLKQIEQYLEPYAGEALAARVTRLLASPLAEPNYPLLHYSKELLFSVKARREWVAPDLKSMT